MGTGIASCADNYIGGNRSCHAYLFCRFRVCKIFGFEPDSWRYRLACLIPASWCGWCGDLGVRGALDYDTDFCNLRTHAANSLYHLFHPQ